jgi:hypothetical protein
MNVDGQEIINAVVLQRNAAMDQLAMATAEIATLKAEIEKLNTPKAKK